MCEKTLLRTIFAAKVKEVKGGGEGCLMVCSSQIAIFSSYCDKQIKNYEMVRGIFEKCIQKFSGKKLTKRKKTGRPSRKWHSNIKINLR